MLGWQWIWCAIRRRRETHWIYPLQHLLCRVELLSIAHLWSICRAVVAPYQPLSPLYANDVSWQTVGQVCRQSPVSPVDLKQNLYICNLMYILTVVSARRILSWLLSTFPLIVQLFYRRQISPKFSVHAHRHHIPRCFAVRIGIFAAGIRKYANVIVSDQFDMSRCHVSRK